MTLAVLRRLFNWHEIRTSKFHSPIVRGMAKLKPAERARDRILTDDEIRRVWAACGDMGLYASLVRFLLLTAARRNEASCIERGELERAVWTLPERGEIEGTSRCEVEGTLWTLPAARNKTKKTFIRPLSEAAMAILSGVPRIVGSSFIFTLDGKRPIRCDGKRKRHLDEISGVTGWRLHDLRRTADAAEQSSRAGWY
jgi:integrase